MNRLFLVIIGLLLFFLVKSPTVFSQSIAFDNTYGYADYSAGKSILQLSDDNYVFLGNTSSYSGKTQLILGKIDSYGKPIFYRQTNDDNILYDGRHLILLKNGNFLVTGTLKKDSTTYQPFCMCFDSLFEKQWLTVLPSADWAWGKQCCELPDHSLVTIGQTYDTDSTNVDAFFCKIASNGNLMTLKKSNWLGDDGYNSVELFDSTSLLVGGFRWNETLQDTVPFFSFLNFDGEETAHYDFEQFKNQAVVNQAIRDSKGNIVTVGYTSMYDPLGKEDFFLTVFDTSGNYINDLYVDQKIWAGEDDLYKSVGIGKNGQIFAGATCKGNNYLQPTILLHLLDADYNWQNSTVRAGTQYDKSDELSQLIPTSDGGCILIGTTTDLGTHLSDILICKIDSLLSPIQPIQHYLPVKEEVEENHLSIFPNPATDFFTIYWENAPQGTSSIELFDLTLHRLFSTPNDFSKNERIRISTHTLPAGCYLLKIGNSNHQYVKKLIVE
ncbi:MAG: T9SS type A sorting domain-containing protein [Bacteroidales bacterium]|nr:T9SS type A sorting domain-containing protein [Bacteroidales bacterium]